MSRRAPDSSDSLELLLDTICNMFGCIVFIAMFLSIFVSDSSQELAKATAGMGAEEALAARDQLDDLEQQLKDATETLDQLKSTISEEDRARIAHDAKQIATLERDIAAAEERLKESIAVNEKVTDWKKSIDGQLSNAKQRQAELDAEKDRLTRELDQQHSMRVGAARLPVVTAAKKYEREIMVILRGKIAYAWRNSSNRAVMVRFSRRGDGLLVSPISGRGIRVNESISTEPRWLPIVSGIQPERQAAYVMVYPDSVEQFLLLRADLLKRGIKSKVEPMAADDDIVLYPGTVTVD